MSEQKHISLTCLCVASGTTATDFSRDAKCKNCQTTKLVATHETFSE